MRDPYAGHRNHDDPWWQPDPLTDTAWTDWDYALLEAKCAIEMLNDPQTGQLRNLTEDPEVDWDIGYRVNYGAQTMERFQKEHEKDDEPGVSFYLTNPRKSGDEPFWGLSDWLKDLESEQQVDRNAPEGARPPTPEELAEMRRRRTEAAGTPPVE